MGGTRGVRLANRSRDAGGVVVRQHVLCSGQCVVVVVAEIMFNYVTRAQSPGSVKSLNPPFGLKSRRISLYPRTPSRRDRFFGLSRPRMRSAILGESSAARTRPTMCRSVASATVAIFPHVVLRECWGRRTEACQILADRLTLRRTVRTGGSLTADTSVLCQAVTSVDSCRKRAREVGPSQ